MKTRVRVITSIAALPLLIIPIYLGGIAVYGLVLLLSVIAFYEFMKAYNTHKTGLVIIGEVGTVAYYVLLYLYGPSLLNPFMVIFTILVLIFFVISFPRVEFKSASLVIGGFFYLTYLLSYIVLIREYEGYGRWFVWFIFLIAFGSDTFAYFAGCNFGKHKLTIVSPKKTVEGAIGGIFGGVLLSVLYGVFMYYRGPVKELSDLIAIAIIGAVGSILGIIGDLVASAIKRQTGIKDFGRLLPGHGGILDRFDSNILIAPLIYYIMMIFIMK